MRLHINSVPAALATERAALRCEGQEGQEGLPRVGPRRFHEHDVVGELKVGPRRVLLRREQQHAVIWAPLELSELALTVLRLACC